MAKYTSLASFPPLTSKRAWMTPFRACTFRCVRISFVVIFCLIYAARNWRQEDRSLLRLLSDDSSGRQMINNFFLENLYI